jgi:hypothetical protein
MAQRKKPHSDHALMIALACGATVEAAARQVGISERAAYKRMEKPEFKRQLQELKADMIQRASSALVAANMEAVTRDGTAPGSSVAIDRRARFCDDAVLIFYDDRVVDTR